MTEHEGALGTRVQR